MDGSLLTASGAAVLGRGALILPPVFQCGRTKQSPKEDRFRGGFLAHSTAVHVPFKCIFQLFGCYFSAIKLISRLKRGGLSTASHEMQRGYF